MLRPFSACWLSILATALGTACVVEDSLPRRAPPSTSLSAGRLMIVGGGGTTPAMTARMLELAGGPDAPILILPQASELEDRGSGSLELWQAAGALNMTVLDPLSEDEGEKLIAESALIWMPGGDQTRLMDALKQARLVDDLQRRYRGGAIVGGTSAGAAVMSRWMITGEADLERVAVGRTELVDGLALWPEAIVDQHFLARQRWARLFAAVLDHPELVGVGIDERTAVEVTGSNLRVIGEGQVVIVDARRAELSPGEAGELHQARGLRTAILRDGQVFSLR